MPQRILCALLRSCLVSTLLLTTVSVQAADLLIQVADNHSNASLKLALVAADQQDWQAVLLEAQGRGDLLHLRDVPPGRYAIQLYQDSNGNGRLDLSPRGLPLEPVGFSSNPSLFKGKPKPKSAEFEQGSEDTQINIRLQHPRQGRKYQP